MHGFVARRTISDAIPGKCPIRYDDAVLSILAPGRFYDRFWPEVKVSFRGIANKLPDLNTYSGRMRLFSLS